MPAEWIMPSPVAAKDRVILYTHGGGYVSGSCNDHRSIVARVVKGSKVGALLFEYRLAPEHPYPAALEDSVAAYRWLLARGISPSKIVNAGESAGGGLCLAMLLALRDQGVPLCERSKLEEDFSSFKIKELSEHEYFEPRATGETHHHISWILVGEQG